MKKFKSNELSKQFGKSKFREFTYHELESVIFEYKLDLLLCSRILNGLFYNDNLLKEEKEDIENLIFKWIKNQIVENDLIPSNSPDFLNIWRLIIEDDQLNPYHLNIDVLYSAMINSNDRNKKKHENYKTGYHVNQGKFGNRKKK